MEELASSRPEGLRREHKLRRRMDFQRCYRKGRKRRGTLATLHFHPNELRTARLGITASRKVGKAVVRERVKRHVREIFRRWPHRQKLNGTDVVVHLWPVAASARFPLLKEELERQLSEISRQREGRR